VVYNKVVAVSVTSCYDCHQSVKIKFQLSSSVPTPRKGWHGTARNDQSSVSKSGQQTQKHITCLKLFMDIQLYLASVSEWFK